MANGILKKVQNTIVKNSPTILSVIGGFGAIASVFLAIDATNKVKKDLEEARKKVQTASDSDDSENSENSTETNNDISTPDKIWIYAKAYAPTAIMLAATEVCIFGSNHLNQKRIATLAGAYILSETNFKEYKDKVEELIGEKKVQEIEDALIQKHVDENREIPQNPIDMNMPNSLRLSIWYDETSRRYFYSNAEYIRKAEIEANAMLQKNGFVSINDVYCLLGMEDVPLGDGKGWQYYPEKNIRQEVVINIGSALMGPDIPVGTIFMESYPSNDWFAAI